MGARHGHHGARQPPRTVDLAGLLLTGIVDGAPGYRDLRSRLLRWRVPLAWYAAAVLFAPVLATVISLALGRIAPRYLPAILTTGDRGGLLATALASGVMIGLLEELGWTGFAVPHLRERRGVLGTGLLLVVLMHVSLVMSTLLLQPAVAGADLLAYILVWAAALWAVSLTVTTVGERDERLRRRKRRTV